ncbi:MAG: IreB family regulatory phosphoprotein [Tissierellia bacterium]|nr:IreB family regulatory phosphoprotein [Tissierellia bacterium]
MFNDKKETMLFKLPREGNEKIVDIVEKVYKALIEKGYEPKNQLIGYILSGDPSYITSHNDARKLIRQIDRDELLDELLTYYLENNNISKK